MPRLSNAYGLWGLRAARDLLKRTFRTSDGGPAHDSSRKMSSTAIDNPVTSDVQRYRNRHVVLEGHLSLAAPCLSTSKTATRARARACCAGLAVPAVLGAARCGHGIGASAGVVTADYTATIFGRARRFCAHGTRGHAGDVPLPKPARGDPIFALRQAWRSF